jgi:peptidoglycan/xylan/chitin deacetylase (PgdA/CDA1 family)
VAKRKKTHKKRSKTFIKAPALLALPAPKRRWKTPEFGFLLGGIVLAVMLLGGQVAGMQPAKGAYVQPKVPLEIADQLAEAGDQVVLLDRQQQISGHHLENPKSFNLRILAIRQEAGQNNLDLARQSITDLINDINSWQVKLDLLPGPAVSNTPLPAAFVPIVMYHDPPSNLDEQLSFLVSHGYTTVDMDQVAAALAGGPGLPAKPVVITFDDGFASQWEALPVLLRYHLKATFYVIDGGAGSAWHIGANRRLPDPQGGPAYLNWEQIKQIDHNPLFTIGSHTINHLNLADQSAEIQRIEIFDGKKQLEAQLGHPVRTFAYPYGAYNATSVDLVREAGFSTAVTTEDGTDQKPGDQLVLHRIRSTLTLP